MNHTRRPRRLAAIGAGLGAALIVGAGLALATTTIDLSTNLAKQTYNGAQFIQGPLPSATGTGIFNPFLRISNGGNDAAIEQGYNTDFRPLQFNEDGPWTNALQLSVVPIVQYEGVAYREFVLDINQQKSVPLLSLDKLRIYLAGSALLTDYDVTLETFSGASYPKVWDLGDAYVKLNYDLPNVGGSGNSDMTLLIPDSVFQGVAGQPYCAYGAQACSTFVYFYSLFGSVHPNNDGFEEWATVIRPTVLVSKTAVPYYERTNSWKITKTVTPGSWDLFTGESGTSEYTVAVDKTVTESNFKVTGTITIQNPAAFQDGTKTRDAIINSVADVFTPTVGDPSSAAVSCGVTFPYTLKSGSTLNCTYTLLLDGKADGINKATVTLADTDLAPFSATAPVAFGAPAVVNGPESITVTDTNAAFGGPKSGVGDDASWSYSRTFTCDADAGKKTNTATIVETGQSAQADVTVNCYSLTTTKDAAASYTKTWTWKVDKSVTPGSWDLFTGESGTSGYTVTYSATSALSAQKVTGTITVSNPAPMVATLTGVADAIGAVNGTVICPSLTVPAKGTLACTYVVALPDATATTTGTNTATATQQLYTYDKDGKATADGTKAYSGSAGFDFAAATVSEVDESIAVGDTFVGSSVTGDVTAAEAPKTFTYNRTFLCDRDKGQNDNTASFKTNDTGATGSDDASVTVNCYKLSVTKDADTTYTRTYTWDILKSSPDPTSIKLAIGETYDYRYSVKVSVTGFKDSDWMVAGGIKVVNATPLDAVINSVADVLTVDGAAAVTCPVDFPYTLKAGMTLSCTYAKKLPGANDQVNTATATQQLFDYDAAGKATADGTKDYKGSADVKFGAPTKLVDEMVTVTDSYAGELGTVTVAEAPKTFTYTRTFGPYDGSPLECGEFKFPNTAKFVTNDTGATGESSWEVTVTVDCFNGCTLTQGYWKTHSEFGPAKKADPTWYLIGDADGDGLVEGPSETFFLSNQTWYEVMWTPPAGGNAYYNLAHQWIAAYLNTLTGASVPAEVAAALAWGEDFFESKTPAQAAELKGKPRNEVIKYAGILAKYNEGLIGPGHCDMDYTARTAL